MSTSQSANVAPISRHPNASATFAKRKVAPETLTRRALRYALAMAYAFQPKRIATVPPLVAHLIRYALTPAAKRTLPATDRLMPGPEFLTGLVHDTSPAGLLEGLRAGMQPTGHVLPLKWSSPHVRCIVMPGQLHIEKNLSRLLRKAPFSIAMDTDPLGVLQGCAAPRKGRPPLTWITPAMQHIQLDLFEAGIMHTVEIRDGDGGLVGGLFGYAVDDLFMIKSQFHTVRDASKVATVALMAQAFDWGFTGADGGFMTGYLKSFGFQDISREELARHQSGEAVAPRSPWTFDTSLDLGKWKPANGPCPRKAD